MRKEFTPRPFQPPCVQFMLDVPRCALWAPPGMGKTIMAYTALDTAYIASLVSKPTLVLGPLRVARDVWPDEVRKWRHLRHIDVAAIVGTEKERLAATRRDVAVYSANYEQIPWLVNHYGKKWPFEVVIADESTKLKNFRLQQGGRRAGLLGKFAHTYVKRWINLTGTPSPNGLKDLWGQTWFQDRGQRLGLSFSAFSERWFRKSFDGWGLVPFKHSEKEIHAALKDICMSLDAKDWFDIKDPIVSQVRVKLPPAARKIYDDFEATMFAELADASELEVFNAAAMTNKCLQIANGAVIQGKEGWKAIHDAKLEALDSLLEESGCMPTLVQYNFISDKERILKKYPDAALLATKEGMKRFKAGQAEIGLFHAKSVGHGTDGLQHVTNRLVRFGHDWNWEERTQAVERIGPVRQLQAGLDRPTFVWDIIAEDTVDDLVLASHEDKREVNDILMAAVKLGWNAHRSLQALRYEGIAA